MMAQSADIKTVAVVGCGVIGMSWACLFLSKGLRVIISDPAEGAEDRFGNYLQSVWGTLASTDTLEGNCAKNYEVVCDILPRISEADFIQESGPEALDLKRELLKSLDQRARQGVVIASSSSGLPSSTFITLCENEPTRILVGHPFNPPHLIPLVEVVPNSKTSAACISTAVNFYKSLGKEPIVLRQETPGFVANRLQAAINKEAYSLITRGVVSAEDLDTAVRSGPGLRWAVTGPIVTNALGGGGGPEGFDNRLDRLGAAIQSWEQDMRQHEFNWSAQSVSCLKSEAKKWLNTVNWEELDKERNAALTQLLASRHVHSNN